MNQKKRDIVMETIDWWDTSHAPAALPNPVTSPLSPLPHTNPIRVSAPQAANGQRNPDLASMTHCGDAPCALGCPQPATLRIVEQPALPGAIEQRNFRMGALHATNWERNGFSGCSGTGRRGRCQGVHSPRCPLKTLSRLKVAQLVGVEYQYCPYRHK